MMHEKQDEEKRIKSEYFMANVCYIHVFVFIRNCDVCMDKGISRFECAGCPVNKQFGSPLYCGVLLLLLLLSLLFRSVFEIMIIRFSAIFRKLINNRLFCGNWLTIQIKRELFASLSSRVFNSRASPHQSRTIQIFAQISRALFGIIEQWLDYSKCCIWNAYSFKLIQWHGSFK